MTARDNSDRLSVSQLVHPLPNSFPPSSACSFPSYGTQQPIALLKLFFEKGGMYDREKDLSWKKFKDMTFYAAMGTAGGGRNEVDPRFISMFSVYNIVFPNDESLIQIYSSIFKGHLNYTKFEAGYLKVADMMVLMTLKLFKVCYCNVKRVDIYGGKSVRRNTSIALNSALKSLTNFMKFDLHMQITAIFHNLLCCLDAIQWKLFNGL